MASQVRERMTFSNCPATVTRSGMHHPLLRPSVSAKESLGLQIESNESNRSVLSPWIRRIKNY